MSPYEKYKAALRDMEAMETKKSVHCGVCDSHIATFNLGGFKKVSCTITDGFVEKPTWCSHFDHTVCDIARNTIRADPQHGYKTLINECLNANDEIKNMAFGG